MLVSVEREGGLSEGETGKVVGEEGDGSVHSKGERRSDLQTRARRVEPEVGEREWENERRRLSDEDRDEPKLRPWTENVG